MIKFKELMNQIYLSMYPVLGDDSDKSQVISTSPEG